jgi:restriction system protein
MATTHTPPRRTSKNGSRHRSRLRLPQLTLGGIVLTLLIGYAAVRTWPVQSAILAGLLAVAVVLRATQPRHLGRLQMVIGRAAGMRYRLPAGRRTLAAFQAMDPTRFEHAITELANQHPDIRHAQHSGQTADRGMDVLAVHHDGRRILIQCKKYAPGNNVGSSTVREVVGSVLAHRCDYGVIVTTAGYTTEAVATNHTLGAHALVLIDGPALEQWAAGSYTPWRR